jgi:hypothetical protein
MNALVVWQQGLGWLAEAVMVRSETACFRAARFHFFVHGRCFEVMS